MRVSSNLFPFPLWERGRGGGVLFVLRREKTPLPILPLKGREQIEISANVFLPREIDCTLERAGESSTVDENVLSGNVAGLGRAQECASRAEFVRLPDTPRRHGRNALGKGGLGAQ